MSGQGFQVGKSFSIVSGILNPTSNFTGWAAVSGGSLASGTYYFRYTWVTSNGGETLPSPEQSQGSVTSTNNAINLIVPSFPSGVIACNIYVGTVGVSGQETYQGQVTSSGGSFLVTSISSGRPLPQFNTTSFQDINPSSIGLTSTNEFIVHNLYYGSQIAFGIYDGTNLTIFDSDTGLGAREKVAHHCNSNQWLRVFNTSSINSLQFSFDGIQTQ